MERISDIAIAGAGPAGSALAAALAERGVEVVLVDPCVEKAWPARYGAWLHEAEGLDLPWDHTWDEVTVDLGDGPVRLDGSYGWVDRTALHARFRQSLLDGPGSTLADSVVGVQHEAGSSVVTLASGDTLRVKRLVDATGRGLRTSSSNTMQSALGVRLRAEHGLEVGQAVFMDYRRLQVEPELDTFAYILPLSEEQVFVQETLLAGPAVSRQVLQARLDARLASMNLDGAQVLEVERCRIPLDVAPPSMSRTLVIGAAAGWVHPATGYQFVRALRTAGPLADVLAQGIDQLPDVAIAAAWQVIWPSPLLTTRALHDIGQAVLLELDSDALRAFFDAFFSAARWPSYLDAETSPSGTALAMTQVFASLSGSMRLRVARLVLGQLGNRLATTASPLLSGGTP